MMWVILGIFGLLYCIEVYDSKLGFIQLKSLYQNKSYFEGRLHI